MAKGKEGQTVGGLFIELGLDLSRLQSDFLAADRTVSENISRLNRERNIIRLRMEADTAGLDRAKDAAKIFEIQEKSLNQQLTISRDRMTVLEAAYKQVANNANATAVAVNRAEQAFLREKVIVGQLEQELRALSSQKTPLEPNRLLSGYQNLKGSVAGTLQEISGAFNQLKDSTSSADAAITSTLGVIGTIPSPVGKAVASLAALPIVIRGIENSFLDMAKAAAASGDSFYVMSRGMQMSIPDTAKFVTMCNIAGAEVNEVATAVKRAQQQIVKGGADSKGAEELRRYGESAYDASGHLKNLNDMVLTFNRAMKKAQAEGREAEFVMRTFRNASGDVITTLEDAVGNYESAEKIIKGGLSNPELAHNVQGLINELNTQTGKLKANLATAFLPAAEEFVPKLTERMKGLTQVMADNKDVIREFGRDVGEIFLAMESGAEKVIGAFGTLMKFAYDLRKSPYQDELVERFKSDLDMNSVDDLIRKAQPKAYDVIKNNALLYAQVKAKYEPIYRAIADAQAEIKAKQEEAAQEIETSLSGDTLKYRSETQAIMDKSSLNDYQKKIYDIRAWENKLLEESEKSESERIAIKDLANAKIAEAERELADKLQEIRDSVAAADKSALENKIDTIKKEGQAWLKAGMDSAEAFELTQRKIAKAQAEAAEKTQQYLSEAADIEFSLTHTAYEKQIRDIERWKEAKIKAGEDASAIITNAAAKEAQAFEREVDRIKGLTQSLDDKIFELDHSQYESDLRRIQQEYTRRSQEYAEAGLLPTMQGKLDYLYMRQKQKLDTKAAESREKGGDYAKSPTGVSTWNGFPMLQQSTSLLTNENLIRGRLIDTLSEEAKAAVARTQSIKDMLPTMPSISAQLASASIGDKTIIEGDEITQISMSDFKGELEKAQAKMREERETLMQQVQANLALDSPLKILEQNNLAMPQQVTFETVVTPLNSISNAVNSILSELRNRQPAQINVSPNQNINLGGAYVFDEAMKVKLVDDITTRIVDEITSAVRQATSNKSYSYSS